MSLSLGLIGYPLEGSLSPRLHAANLRRLGLEGEYNLYRVPPLPEGQTALQSILARLRSGELHGLNVTLPHKQTVLPLLDCLTPTAQHIGAVNTLFVKDGQVWGDNTDAPGFWDDLQMCFPALFASDGLAGHAIVLGAGGAARAVVYMLLAHGWRVSLAARRLEQAEALQRDFSGFAPALAAVSLERVGQAAPARLLVNASSAGMLPHAETCPWPEGLPLPSGVCVYDLVYKPPRTRLLQMAEAAGLPYANGLGMLEKQAELALERWV